MSMAANSVRAFQNKGEKMYRNKSTRTISAFFSCILFLLASSGCGLVPDNQEKKVVEPTILTLKATARYLNLPVTDAAPETRVRISAGSRVIDEFDIHLSEEEPDYFVFLDLGQFQGQVIHVDIPALPADSKGPDLIKVSDQIAGSENLYKEPLRQQFHFSCRRGWNNDPNGLVFLDGEYHLYYQHNPYGWPWGNMHWGHAVSTDLVHWKELPIAIYPAEYGDWAFSGSAIIDYENLSGFQSGDSPVMVVSYTSTGRGEVIAYSNDRGRTFSEYKGNPVIEHKGRDPKIIWYAPGKHWSAAVYHEENDKQWIAFYSSPDLKEWTYNSKIEGFYECPELFEINVDGTDQSKWVLYGADGSYMIGNFNGNEFMPESEKINFHHGDAFYASQTFNNIPGEDGRRIQIAWGRTDSPGMPFNQCMLVPVSLSLKKTSEGLRLLPSPVSEIAKIHLEPVTVPAQILDAGYYPSPAPLGATLHLKASWEQGKKGITTLTLAGFKLKIDSSSRTVTMGEKTANLPGKDGKISLEILLDRLSMEVFINQGEVYMPLYLSPDQKTNEYALELTGESLKLESLTVWPLKSIWE
jgi:fructan beta-fructosidase